MYLKFKTVKLHSQSIKLYQMNMYALLVISVINLSVGTSSTITEKYYEELIRQRTAEAESYNLPTTNNEFKPGVQSNTTHGKQLY